MKIFSWFFFLSFLFYPILSFGDEEPPATGPKQCQAELKGLQKERTAKQEEYNEDCDSESSSSAKCLNLRQRISELNSQISSQSQKCQAQALEIKKRKIEDANAKVKKHNQKTKNLGTLSSIAGGVALAKGMSCCASKGRAACCKIYTALGIAGIAMGQVLFNKGKELDKVVDDITDTADTCVGEGCTPPPPPGTTPPPGGVGTGLLSGTTTLPELPPFANCEPSCPCPGEPEKLPPNCKITNDKDGNPKVTYGEDKDKDGFGDEQITSADAAKLNRNDPRVQAAMAEIKAPYADMLAELEEDMEEDEELLAEADESGAAGEGFLSGGATVPGRSAASSSGSSRRRHRGKGDDVNKTVQGLMAQFLNKKKKKKVPKAESKLLGNSQIGVAQDNIFLMVHRRYQERRGEREFFEQRGGGSSFTHNISQ